VSDAPDPWTTSVEVPAPGDPDRTSPADPSLSTVLGALEAEGWAGQLVAEEGGTVRCVTCGEHFRPSAAEAGPQRRLEGVSDPADMLIVAGLRCPHCETRGVLVASFGPEAGAADADVVGELPG